MEGLNYFFDTYAIIEIVKKNKNYAKYRDEEATITIFNLAEIYWSVLNEFGEEKADIVFDGYKKAVVEINDETLKEAIKFRKKHKNKDLSYADCIGYIYALKHNLVFLTGDKEFEKLDNVEFVK
ncbi:MAG: PIN domain-containing protein [Nanoarchaeota archaeon]